MRASVLNLISIILIAQFAKASFIDDLFKIFDSGDPELEDEEEKIHSRQKRQDVTQVPTTPIPSQYEHTCPSELYRRLDKCCKIPQLYPTDVLNKCTGRNPVNDLPKNAEIRNVQRVQLRLRKNYLTSSAKNFTMKSRIEEICKVHCIFKLQRWLTPENFIDEELMYKTLSILFPPGPYQNLILNGYVRTECSGISLYGVNKSTILATKMYGQRCTVAPFRMLRCIKRSMLLATSNCPGIQGQSRIPVSIKILIDLKNIDQTCDLDKAYLRQCDVFSSV